MANKDRIIHNNLWRIGNIGTPTSEHPQFPAVDTETDTLSQAWRTRYGTDSGNGQFVIDSTNKYIDFNEGGSELNATLTEATYAGNSLATEVKTQLDAAGALTYTVAYSESTGKFTISAASNFSLLWKTGTHGSDNLDTHAGTTLGYDDTADDSGTNTYTSDNRRDHWPYEELARNLLTAYQYNFVALLGHNISASATIKIWGADDADFTVNAVSDTITHNSTNLFFFLSAARTKQYIKIQVADPTNAAGYVKIATIFVGSYWEPSRKYAIEYQQGVEDLSEYEESDSRNFYAIEKPGLDTYFFSYPNIDTTSKAYAIDLMRTVGLTKAFIICTDYETPNSYSYYVRNNEEIMPVEGTHKDYCNWSLSVKEVV